jgi:AcrR family transcriptional regulator
MEWSITEMHSTGAFEKRQRNQRGEGTRLKDELIDAAMRILDRSPDARLSLRMVAKEAGVAAPSVYRHFSDVSAMMAEIVRVCWAQMGAHLIKASEAIPASEPLDSLKAKMSAFVLYAMERPSRYHLLFARSYDPEHDIDGPLRPAFRPVRETIEEIAATGGKVPAEDPFTAALLIISIAHGRIALAHLAPRRPGNFAPDVESFVQEAIALLFTD